MSYWWQIQTPLKPLVCPHCGREITRKRGNLRSTYSLRRATESLLARHIASQYPVKQP